MTTGEAPPPGPDQAAQQSDPEGEPMAATDAAPKAARAKDSATKAAMRTKATTGKAAKAAKESATKAAATVRAARAAREGRVKEARAIATEADLDPKALAEFENLHYQVEVNKRGLSVSSLTTTLNQRWDNGWRLAHVIEQRGNTVLVFEKRSPES
jgi:hypothetical protein